MQAERVRPALTSIALEPRLYPRRRAPSAVKLHRVSRQIGVTPLQTDTSITDTHELALDVEGSRLRASVDGTVVLDKTDTNITAAGQGGVIIDRWDHHGGTHNLSVDDFKISEEQEPPELVWEDFTETYHYDSYGNVTSVTDKNGRVRTFQYDDLERKVSEAWFESEAESAASEEFGSVELHGVDDHLTLGADLLTGDFTVSLWFNADNVDDLKMLFWQRETQVYYNANGTLIAAIQNTDIENTSMTHQTAVTADEWHHVVFTFDGEEMNLYLDGVAATPKAYTHANTTPRSGAARLGRDETSYPTHDRHFDGHLADVRILDTAASAAMVDQLRAAIGTDTTFGEVAHWKFGEGEGGSAADSSGGGHTATLQNGAQFASETPAERNANGSLNVYDYSYDVVHRTTGTSDAVSDYTYTYDHLDRLVTTTINNVGTPEVTLTNGYDDTTFDNRLDGLRTSLTATIDGVEDFETRYSYDRLLRLTRVTQEAADVNGNAVAENRVNLTYDSENYLTGIERYEDLTATAIVASSAYVYDEKNRLTSLEHDQGATSLASYFWVYDSANRITQRTSSDGVVDYLYDDRGQLVSADYDYQADESYAYDANGNRVTANGASYTTGDHNRLTNNGESTYEYDPEGNQTVETDDTTGDQFDNIWDHLNRLDRVIEKDALGTVTKEIDYAYDIYDRLIFKQVDDDGDGTFDRSESYIYDGHDQNQIILRFEDSDGEGTQESAELNSRYLWNHVRDEIWAEEKIDELLGPTTVGKTYWTLNDNLGTVTDIAKHNVATGNTEVVTHRTYDAFGQLLTETNPSDPGGEVVEHQNAFTGRYRDEDTGDQRHGKRVVPPQGRPLAECRLDRLRSGRRESLPLRTQRPGELCGSVGNGRSGVDVWQRRDADLDDSGHGSSRAFGANGALAW